MTKLNVLVFLATATLAACGGDSGVDSSKKLSDLSMQEAKDACLELVADFPPRTVTCPGGVMITIGTKEADCNGEAAPATCTATVGDARACAEAMSAQTDTQLCSDTGLPAVCAKLVGC